MSYECKTCGAKLLNRDECARCDHETIEALNEDVARLKAELAAANALLKRVLDKRRRGVALGGDLAAEIRATLERKTDA